MEEILKLMIEGLKAIMEGKPSSLLVVILLIGIILLGRYRNKLKEEYYYSPYSVSKFYLNFISAALLILLGSALAISIYLLLC